MRLQRRCIDVYVSYRKAEAAGQYKHVDTTDAPVRLDAAHYAHWAAQARAWYAGVTQALDRCNGVVAHAARLLNLRRTTLVEKLRKLGIETGEVATED